MLSSSEHFLITTSRNEMSRHSQLNHSNYFVLTSSLIKSRIRSSFVLKTPQVYSILMTEEVVSNPGCVAGPDLR